MKIISIEEVVKFLKENETRGIISAGSYICSDKLLTYLSENGQEVEEIDKNTTFEFDGENYEALKQIGCCTEIGIHYDDVEAVYVVRKENK